MKKVYIIIITILFLSSNVLAKPIKRGSGPLKLTEEAVKIFHIYLNQKISAHSFNAQNLPGMTYQLPDSKARYANYFLIRGKNSPYIFVWWNDENIRAGEGGFFGCENGACKQFAKKNKIVWKGAKKRISRKVTLEELKSILKELGFYD